MTSFDYLHITITIFSNTQNCRNGSKHQLHVSAQWYEILKDISIQDSVYHFSRVTILFLYASKNDGKHLVPLVLLHLVLRNFS